MDRNCFCHEFFNFFIYQLTITHYFVIDHEDLSYVNNTNALLPTGGIQWLKSVSNLSALSDPKGHDKGYNA